MEPTSVFWTERTGLIRRWLRCYQSNTDPKVAPGETSPAPKTCASYCNALRHLDDIEAEFRKVEDGREFQVPYDPAAFPWDAFSTVCDHCGRQMDKPERQIFVDEIMEAKTGPTAGQRWARREMPIGAMYDMWYYKDWGEMQGPDGICLIVKMPGGGEWFVDGRANNCTKPDDKVHKCWVRVGDPKTGYVHVSKEGNTCDAGAGSIWMNAPNGWHGFLYRGYLCECDDKWKVDRLLDVPPAAVPIAPVLRVMRGPDIDRARVANGSRDKPDPYWLKPKKNQGFQRRPKT
jgi:hypothetical protein